MRPLQSPTLTKPIPIRPVPTSYKAKEEVRHCPIAEKEVVRVTLSDEDRPDSPSARSDVINKGLLRAIRKFLRHSVDQTSVKKKVDRKASAERRLKVEEMLSSIYPHFCSLNQPIQNALIDMTIALIVK